jgi:ATP-dependent 26S proteasome regulatory subunit
VVMPVLSRVVAIVPASVPLADIQTSLRGMTVSVDETLPLPTGVLVKIIDAVPYSVGTVDITTTVAVVRGAVKYSDDVDSLDAERRLLPLGTTGNKPIACLNIAMLGALESLMRLSPGPALSIARTSAPYPLASASEAALRALAFPVGTLLTVAGNPGTGFYLEAASSEADHRIESLSATSTEWLGAMLLDPIGHANTLAAVASAAAPLSVEIPMTVGFTLPVSVLSLSTALPSIASRVELVCRSELLPHVAISPEEALHVALTRAGRTAVDRGNVLRASVVTPGCNSTPTSSALSPADTEATLSTLATTIGEGRSAAHQSHDFSVIRVEGGSIIDPQVTQVALVGAAHTLPAGQLVAQGCDEPQRAAVYAHPAFKKLLQSLRRVVDPTSLGYIDNSAWCRLVAVHGAPQNAADEVVLAALDAAGMRAHVLDARLVDARTMIQYFGKLLAKGAGPSAAVVLRHAEALDVHGEAARFLASASSGAAWTYEELRQSSDDPKALAPTGTPLLVVATFEGLDAPSAAIVATTCVPLVTVTTPSERERADIIAAVLAAAAVHSSGARCSRAVAPSLLASWAVGLGVTDLVSWVVSTLRHHRSLHGGVEADAVADASDFSASLKSFQLQHGHNLTSTKLQPVKWDDVGGLEEAKREILETIELPLKHPHLFKQGAKQRAGVLMYGPPGCGKTLLAKAVATEMGLNFISVKGPELINSYVGESERNIRNLFQRARDNSPCIAFFDELDALAPKRGAKGDSGGVMDRIVAQLLAEVDGVGASRSDGSVAAQVFIIGATNRPDLLDPSLLRPGRFDRLCYLGPPATPGEQVEAIKALTRKFDLGSDVDFAAIIEPLPPSVYTGADYFALCSDAMMLAVDERVLSITAALEATGKVPEELETRKLRVEQKHFLHARDKLKPSVSAQDLRRYEGMKQQFVASGGVGD